MKSFQSQNVLTNWRSTIGKAAISILAEYFKSDDELQSFDSRAEFSENELSGFNFVYADPTSEVRVFMYTPLCNRFV